MQLTRDYKSLKTEVEGIQKQITQMEINKLTMQIAPNDVETDPDLSCFICKQVKREVVYFPCKHFLAC